jgi:hypothetical protein
MTTNEFLGERTRERDRFELELSDAFDVKASIVLLILTFLGTISTTILTTESLTRIPKLAQIPVIAFIVISVIFCVAGLWPKDYLLDDLPETYSKWLAGVEGSESDRLESITRLSLDLANRRIAHNHALNKAKTRSLNSAFWSMLAALFAMLVALFVELGAIACMPLAIRPS